VVADPGKGVAVDRRHRPVRPGWPRPEGSAGHGPPRLRRRRADRPAGRASASLSAPASSGSSGSRTVSGLPLVNWTECSVAITSYYERDRARQPRVLRTVAVLFAPPWELNRYRSSATRASEVGWSRPPPWPMSCAASSACR
jgi:hypothetical protein